MDAGWLDRMFGYQSGRVVALGRAMLAAIFLLAIWLDGTQPAQAPIQSYAVLATYLLVSAGLALVTWRSWWLDARLAVPAHLIDMAAFTFVVFSTNGYTSPFFLLFMLPLLSSSIRWGWRATALTSVALIVIFFTAGLLVAGSQSFELQRFVVRTGHLIILSAILIWFGMHQRLATFDSRLHWLDPPIGDGDPRELVLKAVMAVAHAGRGTILLRDDRSRVIQGLRIEGGASTHLEGLGDFVPGSESGPAFLFDIRQDRALCRPADGHARAGRASVIVDQSEAARLGLGEGLAARITSASARGWVVLEQIPDLSSDYTELGIAIARDMGALLDRTALLSAMAEGAGARARLSLARDVHDGIVQFIAGATFRVEAIARAARGGANVDDALTELKTLMVEEQGELRGFVDAMRDDRALALDDSVDELRVLAGRLGQHWAIKCRLRAKGGEVAIPIRLHLDLQHLLREAVANAVRHGDADQVDVSLDIDGDQLLFGVRDNGRGFTLAQGSSAVQPWSLRERVERANGSLLLISEPGRTDLSISLPLSGLAA